MEIKKVIDEKIEQIRKEKQRFKIEITKDEYIKIFEHCGILELAKRGYFDEQYEITRDLEKLVNEFWQWLTINEEYKGKINGGFLILGKNGTGKTIAIQTFFSTIEILAKKIFLQYSAKKLSNEIQKNGIDEFMQRTIFIDDIGKEPRQINDYGTKYSPIIDLISMRYDANLITFLTANYSIDTLRQMYGETITQRLTERYNIFELNDKIRRK